MNESSPAPHPAPSDGRRDDEPPTHVLAATPSPAPKFTANRTVIMPATEPAAEPFAPAKTVMGLGNGDTSAQPPPDPTDWARTQLRQPLVADDDDAQTTVRPQPNWDGMLGPGIGPWSGALIQSSPPPPMTLPPAEEPPRRSRAGIALLTGLAVVCAGVGAMLLRPQKGGLSVDLAVEGGGSVPAAEVFIDGHKVDCPAVPCTIGGLAAGPRILQVVVPGFIAPDAAAEKVDAGKQRSVVVPVRPSPSSTGFRVGGNQPGVKVFVDGADQGPLPARVVELAPGTHRLRFSGGERFAPLERTVDVAGGQIRDIGEIRLKVLLGRITVENATPGARVRIVRDGARKLMHGPWPMTLDVDATQGWTLMASAPGRRDLVQPLTFSDGQPVQSIRIDLPTR